MRVLNVVFCLLMLCVICMAETAEYFDKEGLKLYASRNYTEATEYFGKAISQDPGYVDAWVHKGDAQRALKDFNTSLQSYGRALEIDGNKTKAWAGMIESYTALKDYTKAYSATAKLTKLDPGNKAYWLKEGNLLQMQGLYNESILKYEGALILDQGYVDGWVRKGDAQISGSVMNSLTFGLWQISLWPISV